MRDDNHHGGAGGTSAARGRAHGRHDVAHGHMGGAQVGGVPHHGAWGRGADDPDLHAVALNNRERLPACSTTAHYGVCRQKRKSCLCDDAGEQRYAVVELVIAHGCRVVLHGVHGRDHGVWCGGVDARRTVGERISLQQVAGVDEDDALWVGRANGIDDGRGAGEAAGRFGGVGVVVPAAEAAVHVGRGGDDDFGAAGWLGAHGPGCQCDDGSGNENCEPFHWKETTPWREGGRELGAPL